MRRILLTLITFAIFSVATFAQNFIVEPSPANVSGLPGDQSMDASSKVINQTNETLNLRWERIVIDMPSEWDAPICDNVLCWAPHISAKDFTLAPNEAGDMKVSYRPNDAEGNGEIHMLIYDPLDSLNTVQEHIYYGIATTVSVKEPEEADFTIYPNPAKDFVVLPENNQIKKAILYNIAGKQVRAFDMVANTSRFDVADLMRGTYLLQFIDEAGTILHTTRLTKR